MKITFTQVKNTLVEVNGKATLCRNGLIIGSVADKFIPPERVNDSRFFAYTAEDKTYRICRIGKPYKVRPATPAMFAVVPEKKTRKKKAVAA